MAVEASVAGVIVGIDHVQVAAPPDCEEAARRFYGELLGLPEVPKPAALAARGGVWFACGAQQLHVGIEEGSRRPRRRTRRCESIQPRRCTRWQSA
jgi:catechol 2,3-dioxygenase-like lactoylglutathione lyase family enzyme